VRRAYRVLVGGPEGWGDNLDDLGTDGGMVLEWILGRWGGRVWTEFIWLRVGTGGGLLWTQS
jgi:hypothetical protein